MNHGWSARQNEIILHIDYEEGGFHFLPNDELTRREAVGVERFVRIDVGRFPLLYPI
jgi:hypothetical protein